MDVPDEGIARERAELESQVAGAEWNSMPVVNGEAISQLSEASRAAYAYDNLEDFWRNKGHVSPMYPLESDGVHASWDDYQEAWERVLKA